MKPSTKISPALLTLPALAATLGLLATSLLAQEKTAQTQDTQSASMTIARVSFSDKTKPGTLKINAGAATIKIEGADIDEVIVASTLDQKDNPKFDANGFRRIDDTTTFELVEKDNIATLTAPTLPIVVSGVFKIQVPRNTNLSIKTYRAIKTPFCDGVETDNIDGDIEIAITEAGNIRLKNAGNSALASTESGMIDAGFKRAPQKPVLLASENGDITLALPPATAASLRLSALTGLPIRTDFPVNMLQTTNAPALAPAPETSVPQTDAARIAAIQAEIARRRQQRSDLTTITGKLNGGGVDIQLAAMKGVITLKQEK